MWAGVVKRLSRFSRLTGYPGAPGRRGPWQKKAGARESTAEEGGAENLKRI